MSSFPRPRVDVDGDRRCRSWISAAVASASTICWRHGALARILKHTSAARSVRPRGFSGRSRKRLAWSPGPCGRTLTPGRSAAALTITMAVGQHNETSAPAGRAAPETKD